MNPYGDGSDGALNVTSGSHSLALNTKYQFSSVNIASGATLTSGSPTGSVLYILCNGTFTLNGTINVSGVVNRGHNTWDVTIDGTTYSSPGVASGGNGANDGFSGFDGAAVGGTSANGYGGGGSGSGRLIVHTSNTYQSGGNGGSGSASPSGGAGVYRQLTTNGASDAPGQSGSGSGGGSGSVSVYLNSPGAGSVAAQSGNGASSHGADGSTGGGNNNTRFGGSWGWVAGGGGGGGGLAGRAGVHVVIKAKTLVINGTIITSGDSGGTGGNGARTSSNGSYVNYWGGGGGGGGGGNAGNVLVTYDETYTGTPTTTLSGGAGGAGGSGGINNAGVAPSGSTGATGSLTVYRITEVISTLSGGGLSELVSETATIDIISGGSGGGKATYITNYQGFPQKEYEYRVFDSDGDYINTWKDIESTFSYNQTMNQAPSDLVVDIGRSPENRRVIYDYLLDNVGAQILDNNSDPIFLQTETANAVGADTDIELNYRVDVYAFYGGYESLIDEFGDEILDETNEAILVQYGAPNGVRVYSGYIADYELRYGEKNGVRVVVAPFAAEMSHYVYKSGSNTTVTHNSTDPVQMARLAMDNYHSQGGMIEYETGTMPLSGESSSYTFKLQTTREVIDKALELLPSGYYHYVHPGENKQYLLQKSATADHTFYLGKHITELNLRKSITQLTNKVYFVGGGTGTDDLFKYYEDSASITAFRPGLKRLADSRVTLDASAEALAERELSIYSEPRYRTSVAITDAVYDIETIRLGEMVGFKNTGSFVDDLILQIVELDKQEHEITLKLDMIVPNDTKRLHELKKSLQSEEVRNIPALPS